MMCIRVYFWTNEHKDAMWTGSIERALDLNLTINQYTIRNTFTFVQNLLNIPNANEFVMASFDVTNKFTNVPLDETINIIVNLLFRNSNYVFGLNQEHFRKLLNIGTKDISLFFNGKLYKQIEGFAMGSPVGPTLANIFMCHNEEIWLNNCPSDSNQCTTLDIFTSDVENNGSLPFLDVNISGNDNSYVISVFRKPTYTGLTTKFRSYIPAKYNVYNNFKIIDTSTFEYDLIILKVYGFGKINQILMDIHSPQI
nr:uncharacterized protein LOC113819174 [Penaeus vannamei]